MLASPPAALARLLATHRLVLGSKSSSRQAILRELGVPFDCLPADIDEKAIRAAQPAELVEAIARAKADTLRARLAASPGLLPASAKATLLITSDQVVLHNGVVLEKPENKAEARAFIAGYSSGVCSTLGFIVVTNLASGAVRASLDSAHVHFSAIPADVVDRLVADGACMHCAGGLQVEHPLIVPYVARIDGAIDSVQGLGKELITRLLCEAAGL